MKRFLFIPAILLTQFIVGQDDAGINSIVTPTGNICPGSITPIVTLENFGTNTLTSVDVLYNIDGGANATYIWTGSLTNGSTVNINLPLVNTASGAHVFNVITASPNGTTDSNTGNDANSSNFTIGPSINYSATVTNTNCGATDGDIAINANGGTGTLQYSIDGGVTFQASNAFTGLGLGAYNIVIEDANGCQKLGIENVLSNGGPAIIVATGQDPTCYGINDGTIVISATGTGLTFSVNGGVTYQSLAFFQNLAPGTYYVYVKDATGCETFKVVTLAQPVKINTIMFGTNAGCNSSNGSASVLATGGDGNFSYLWDDANNQASSSASSIPAGLYHVTVSDGNGCSVVDSVFIGNNGGPSVSLVSTNTLCNNDTTGSVSTSVGGGTAPYTYLWNDGNSQTSSTATNLAVGTYLVQVSDNNGCLVFGSATISEPEALVSSISIVPASCGNNNGVVIATTSGGTAPYSYQWDDANSQISAAAVNLAAGQYNVAITDANSCLFTDMGEILASDSLLISSETINASCTGIADGSIAITITGGILPYQISWDSGDTTLLVENIVAGNYTVQITDSSGCITSQILTVASESNECLIIPTAFSPNADGKNDFWLIEGMDITIENKVEIYNRWGSLLYQNDAYQNDWDGTSNGENLPTGGYFYIVTILDKTYTGPLAIIR